MKIEASATTLDSPLCDLIKRRFFGQTAFGAVDFDWARLRNVEFFHTRVGVPYFAQDGILNGKNVLRYYVKNVVAKV